METTVQNQYNTISKTIDDIIKTINSGETSVFCGAGISRDSGLPVVNQLIPHILHKLEMPKEHIKLILDDDNNPKIPFEAFMECIKESCDPDLIFDIYGQGEPNTNHILLAKLIKAGKLKTIVTTNFDKLIEKALSMEPYPMFEGKDYDLLYKEEDFEHINWNNQRPRIIKIHGSIDNKELMAITLKQVASQELSRARFAVIKNVFSAGPHKNVLILGYSSSDVFDLSPQIKAINDNYKLVYYVQHSSNPNVENINEQKDKNPFKNYVNSKRIYYNTGNLIKEIWEGTNIIPEPYAQYRSETNWKENINKWFSKSSIEYSKAIKCAIPASVFLKIGISKMAFLYYKKALKIARDIGDKINEGIWLGNIGVVYRVKGDYEKAIECYENALRIAKENEDMKAKEKWLGNLGILYYCTNDYSKAIMYNKQALKIAKNIGDKKDEASWLGSQGNAYASLGKYKKAIEYNEKALKIAWTIGDKKSEMLRFGSLSNAYSFLSDNKKAIKYLKQALKIAGEIGDKKNEGLLLGNLGTTYYNSGDYKKSIKYYLQAFQAAQYAGDKPNEGLWLNNLGIAHKAIRDNNSAINYYEKALKLLIPVLGSHNAQIRQIKYNLKAIKSEVSEN